MNETNEITEMNVAFALIDIDRAIGIYRAGSYCEHKTIGYAFELSSYHGEEKLIEVLDVYKHQNSVNRASLLDHLESVFEPMVTNGTFAARRSFLESVISKFQIPGQKTRNGKHDEHEDDTMGCFEALYNTRTLLAHRFHSVSNGMDSNELGLYIESEVETGMPANFMKRLLQILVANAIKEHDIRIEGFDIAGFSNVSSYIRDIPARIEG